MDFLIKWVYSLLFGLLAWLLFLIFSRRIAAKSKPEICFLSVLAAIATINAFSIASRFVPAAKIWGLIAFDFAIPILYALMQRQLPATGRARIMNENISSEQAKNLRISNFLNLFIIMLYLFQLISIWLLNNF